VAPEAPDAGTPEEALEAAHAKIETTLASEVLTRVKAGSPAFFERLVVELLLKMGYGGSRADRPWARLVTKESMA
jgi:restriction system protein